ncbi:MAG TPA: type II secretion system protein GspM [Allosphingosinicella sp.]|nr:type II secretion system protein GspM [Allosphingosinicella sp.]
MFANFPAWWRARSVREQRLLLLMFGLLFVVLAWLLVVRPLGDALSQARERHGAAVVALAEARTRAAAIARLETETPAPLAGPLDSLLSESATEAGFAVSRLERQGAGQATMVVDAARPQAFFSWMHRMEAERGLIVERLTATANSDRTLAVEVTLRARGG